MSLVGQMPYDLGAINQGRGSYRTRRVIDDYGYNAWTEDKKFVPNNKLP